MPRVPPVTKATLVISFYSRCLILPDPSPRRGEGGASRGDGGRGAKPPAPRPPRPLRRSASRPATSPAARVRPPRPLRQSASRPATSPAARVRMRGDWSHRLHGERHAHAAADAEGGQALLAPAALQLVQQGGED